MKKNKLPKDGDLIPNSWVIRTRNYPGYPEVFKTGELYLFLGEITQTPGHGIFVIPQGENGDKVVHMYHTDDFRMATKDEV